MVSQEDVGWMKMRWTRLAVLFVHTNVQVHGTSITS